MGILLSLLTESNMKVIKAQLAFVAHYMQPLVVPRLNFCLRLQCLGSFPVFVFVNPWTGLSSPIKPSRCQQRSDWQPGPKRFKNSESNSPEWR